MEPSSSFHLVLRLYNTIKVTAPIVVSLNDIRSIASYLVLYVEQLRNFLCSLQTQKIAAMEKKLHSKEKELMEMENEREEMRKKLKDFKQEFKKMTGFEMDNVQYTQRLKPGTCGTIQIPGIFISQHAYRRLQTNLLQRNLRYWV